MSQDYTRRDLLKLAMAGAVAPLVRARAAGAGAGDAGAAAPAPASPAPASPADDSAILAGRAARYRKEILDVAKGPGGMIIAFCPFDTRRPFQEGAPLHWYLVRDLDEVWGTAAPKPTTAEWFYGENTLWATGWLLYAQILRYRVTKDPEARDTAQKCFRDLGNVFRLCRAIEPGLLGKPHGGRAGATTSFDQAACPVIFYTLYAQELGTPEEKAEAVRNMAQHGEYYLRHDWVMNHHAHLARVVERGNTSSMKYLACEYAAFQMTGETRFRDAAFKYMRQLIQGGKLPWPSNPYETNHNPYYYALLCDYWKKTEIASECDWSGCIREYWRAARASLAPNGLPRLGNYDTRNGSFQPYPTKWSPTGRRWSSATLYSNGGLVPACTAALGLLAQSHGADDNAHLVSRRILVQMDGDSLRWFWGEDGKFPEDMKPLLNIFAPEVAGVWQVAYWMGRLQGAW